MSICIIVVWYYSGGSIVIKWRRVLRAVKRERAAARLLGGDAFIFAIYISADEIYGIAVWGEEKQCAAWKPTAEYVNVTRKYQSLPSSCKPPQMPPYGRQYSVICTLTSARYSPTSFLRMFLCCSPDDCIRIRRKSLLSSGASCARIELWNLLRFRDNGASNQSLRAKRHYAALGKRYYSRAHFSTAWYFTKSCAFS